MGATGPLSFAGFGAAGLQLEQPRAFERIVGASHGSIYARGFAEVQRRAVESADRVTSAVNAGQPINTVFPGSPLGQQLRTVARLIAVRDGLAMRRQVFFVATASVTTFTQSDFGRTLTSNGDGTDHAWGGVQIVVGQSVRGRQIFGRYPSLALNGPDDVCGRRIIPAVSADQYAATLARWFGIVDAELPRVAPHLSKFALRDLGFFA
jgi:hypothetical protein